MNRRSIVALTLALTVFGCGEPSSNAELGSLVLALGDGHGDAAYTLAHAHVSLSGPAGVEQDLDGDADVSLSLAPGVYTVTVADDYRVVKRDDPDTVLPARLVGENPTSVLVAPGETTQMTLHFELEAAPNGALGPGGIAIEVVVDATEGAATCARHLRLSEVDYDQAGSDLREFVEVSLVRRCDASLAGVTLELVNGGDGSVYARYALADATATLTADQVLVLGDADVLAGLSSQTPHLTLNGAGLQNGPDALRLVRGTEVLDSLAYEGAVAGVGHGKPAPVDDADNSLTRCSDTGDDATDFVLRAPTPGKFEACAPLSDAGVAKAP